MLEQIRENSLAVLFICGGSVCQRGNGFIDGDFGACLFDLFDLIQMFKYKIRFDFGNFCEGSDRTLYHNLMFAFQEFNKIPGVGRDEIWVNSAESHT